MGGEGKENGLEKLNIAVQGQSNRVTFTIVASLFINEKLAF